MKPPSSIKSKVVKVLCCLQSSAPGGDHYVYILPQSYEPITIRLVSVVHYAISIIWMDFQNFTGTTRKYQEELKNL